MCPSDSVYQSPPVNIAWTNYAGMTMYWAQNPWSADPYSGVFTDFQNTGIRDIKDGDDHDDCRRRGQHIRFFKNGAEWTSGSGKSRASGTEWSFQVCVRLHQYVFPDSRNGNIRSVPGRDGRRLLVGWTYESVCRLFHKPWRVGNQHRLAR